MKKIPLYLVFVLMTSILLSITVNPSLDGRALVADESTFPPGGYYGKAPGYLPGDTVVVTNHSNKLSVEVLILGNQDASEGIAILLSPEAAEQLKIQRDRDVYVNVQKKQAIPFEKAVSTENLAASEKNIADPDKNSTVLPGEDGLTSKDALPYEEGAAKSSELSKAAETSDAPVASEPAGEVPTDYIPAVAAAAPAEKKSASENAGKESNPELADPENPTPDDEYVKIDVELVETDPVYPDSEAETEGDTIEIAEDRTAVKEEKPVEITLDKPEKSTEAENDTDDGEPIVVNEPTPKDVFSKITGDKVAVNPESAACTEDSESCVPVLEAATPVVPKSFDELHSNILYDSFSETPMAKQENTKTYYLQIASLTNLDSIENIIAKYSPRYPIKLVKGSKPGLYQVLVGPLNDDEYELVSARFKSTYKDAYLRVRK